MADLSPALADELEHAGSRVMRSDVGACDAISINIHGDAPYTIGSDPDVRTAIGLALDRKAIVAAAWRNSADASHTWIPPLVLGAHESEVVAPSPDLSRANAVLEAAGWHTAADGVRRKGGQRLSLLLLVAFPAAEHLHSPELIQDQLKRAGIEVRIELMPDAAVSGARRRNGQFDLLQATTNQNEGYPCFLPDLIYYSKSGAASNRWVGDEVRSLLAEALPRTLLLAITALVIAIGFAVPLGTLAAARPGAWPDHLSRAAAVCGTSMPAFFIGYVLMFVFGVRLHMLPIFGYGTARHLVLPAITLALGAAGALTRITRASVADVLAEPFMQAAIARGVPRRRAVWRHALPVALLPIVTVVALAAGHLIGGAMIVEWMFSWPGIGKLGLDAIYNRDYPLIQGVVLLSAVVFTLLNFGADLAYLRIDPRVHLSEGDR